jgi:hypothetical protein
MTNPKLHRGMDLTNAACAALVDPAAYPDRARRELAQAFRRLRKLGYKETTRWLHDHANVIGWPIRHRPNGRYN